MALIPADLAFDRTGCPGGRYCRSDRIDVARDAVGEALELACLCDPFIEPGDVATAEKGHKPLCQLGRRGEFRSLRKQVAEEQPGFSIDLIRILAQIPTATTRGSFPGRTRLCCSSRVCMCTPVSGPSRDGHPTSSITLLLKLPPKLQAHLAAGGPPRFEPCLEGREKM